MQPATVAPVNLVGHLLVQATCEQTGCCWLCAGIKVALPAESASGRCFLQLYIETILALQDASGATACGVQLPLAIMTSDDTHARTEALLKSHDYFGMQPGQVSMRCVLARCVCCQ